jgi:hypothetical protein
MPPPTVPFSVQTALLAAAWASVASLEFELEPAN